MTLSPSFRRLLILITAAGLVVGTAAAVADVVGGPSAGCTAPSSTDGVNYTATCTFSIPASTTTAAGPTTTVTGPTTTVAGPTTTVDGPTTTVAGPTVTAPPSTVTTTATVTAPPSTTSATPTPTSSSPSATPTSSSPTPTSTPTGPPAPAPRSSFPSASNTGVPAGVTLLPYTGTLSLNCSNGPITISQSTINGDIEVSGGSGTDPTKPCVTLTDDLIHGRVHTSGDSATGTGPVVITDSEIAITTTSTADWSGVQGGNIYLTRLNIHGFTGDGVHCDGNCFVYDSWVHDATDYSTTHYNAFLSNGLNQPSTTVLQHNVWQCNMAKTVSGATGGCSGDVSFFGDFEPIANVTINDNYFVGDTAPITSVSASFCLYANGSENKKYPTNSNFVVTNNEFEHGAGGYCGAYKGVIGDWAYNTGDVWSGNTYTDGTPITE